MMIREISVKNVGDIAHSLVEVEISESENNDNVIGWIYISDDDIIRMKVGDLMVTLCDKERLIRELNEQKIVKGGTFIYDDVPLKVLHVEGWTIEEENDFWERDELSYQWEED